MNRLTLLGLENFAARWRANAIGGAIAAEDLLELARLEWLDQKRCLQQMLVLLIAVTGLTMVALVLLSVAVLAQFWDTPPRGLVAWVVAGTWLVAWCAAIFKLVSVMRSAGNGFALTRRELSQDWRDIKERL